IAPAHLEGFGSLEGVARAKREIFGARNTTCMVFPESVVDRLGAIAFDDRAMVVGTHSHADVRIANVRHTDAGVFAHYEGAAIAPLDVEIPLLGEHNAWNFGLVVAATATLGYVAHDYMAAAAALQLPSGRMQRLEYADDVLILQDAYNANPASMRAALAVVAGLPRRGRMVVLGEMKELGPDAD